MLGDWKVQIVDLPMRAVKRLYIWRRLSFGTEVLKGDGVLQVVKEGESFDDSWYFAEMSGDQLQALANALADNGVKTTNDATNEGLLKAQSVHLQDMRQLVFKGKQP